LALDILSRTKGYQIASSLMPTHTGSYPSPEITDELSLKVDFATDHIAMEYLFPNLDVDVDEWDELMCVMMNHQHSTQQ